MEYGLYFSCKVGTLSDTTFDVVEFSLDEALSSLFTLTLTLVSRERNISLNQQLMQPASLTIINNGTPQRTIHGIVASIGQGDSGFKRTYYTLVIRPHLWRLTLGQNSRIFHFKSVPEIMNQLLAEQDVDYQQQLYDPHAKREYITQKRESDYDFCSRLMAEEGMMFWFEEDKLFYSDSHLGMTAGLTLLYNVHPQAAHREQVINRFSYRLTMQPNEVKLKDYRYSHPNVPLMFTRQQSKSVGGGYTLFDSYGRFYDDQQGKQFSRYRLEALQAGSEQGEASSNCVALMPGKIFTLQEHPVNQFNNRWQVVQISHYGRLPQSLAEESDGSPASLSNQLWFMPGENDWRPPFQYKPTADGDEVATVVGPAGEEIYVNEDGCVRVHFHWNRYDPADEKASLWVRVSQGWNGDGFGFLATPRIGQEVIVSYLNGDIDRPIITGTTYNGFNRPPLKLPEKKTQTTFKTKTHKGEGFNELRFDDEAGKEQIFIHAQKDMDVKIKNSKNERIDFDLTTSIGNNEERVIANNRTLTVEGHQNHKTTGNFLGLVEGDNHLSVKGDLLQSIQGSLGVSVSDGLVFKSNQKITLRVGSSFMVIHAGGVDIKGPVINLNSGSASDTALPTNPAILKAAAAAGTPFVAHCPYKDKR